MPPLNVSAIIPAGIAALGAAAGGVRWVVQMTSLRKEFNEHMMEAKNIATQAEATRLLVASNVLQIAEISKAIDRLVKLQDEFFSKQPWNSKE